MRNHRFWIAVLGAWLAAGLCSGPKAAADSATTVKMSISANENYLRRFHKELDALAGAQDEESAKKRASLEQKINSLEAENARLSGVLQKNGASVSAPAAAPTPASPAPTAQAIAPVSPASPPPAQPAGLAVSEWEKMSREQKEKYVQNLVDSLKKEGKTIERHPLFYTALMDYVFVSDSSLAAKPLRDAVIATIQKNEPSFK